MSVIRGKDILFSIDGTAIACAEECDINFAVQFLKARQPNSGKGLHYLPKKLTYKINIAGLLDFSVRADLYGALESFTQVSFSYYTSNVNDGKFYGTVWVESWGESAPTSGLARYNASFIGHGLPSFTEAEPDYWEDNLGNILQDELLNDLILG